MTPAYSLTYIYHDCFLLETKEAFFIFDYWKDPLAGAEYKDFPPLLDELDPRKKIYVLVSHHHKDHFSRRIFLWSRRYPGIQYIISPDVYKAVKYMLKDGGTYEGYRPRLENVNVMAPGDIFDDGTARIAAFASTDIGNSYAVETGCLTIFHAGDLNAWLWPGESTPEEVEASRREFTDIIATIEEKYQRFDIMMFPVDSRQGGEYWWGARYFVERVKTGLFVPMHFELVLSEQEKEQRRIDAAAFKLFYHRNVGAYLQLSSTRSRIVTGQLEIS